MGSRIHTSRIAYSAGTHAVVCLRRRLFSIAHILRLIHRIDLTPCRGIFTELHPTAASSNRKKELATRITRGCFWVVLTRIIMARTTAVRGTITLAGIAHFIAELPSG